MKCQKIRGSRLKRHYVDPCTGYVRASELPDQSPVRRVRTFSRSGSRVCGLRSVKKCCMLFMLLSLQIGSVPIIVGQDAVWTCRLFGSSHLQIPTFFAKEDRTSVTVVRESLNEVNQVYLWSWISKDVSRLRCD